ncbi:phosphatidylserine decarboxylase [Flavobacterium hiemivividum]|uniref:Phosphatidylserine decarboxylase proenzyme n=1 Tax=Flavobacterium hiemivividum TaxID=2541734 RepID=A0A4R5D4D7_9FLAO|nr:phosphatidylserine decarboxylase [Flavobacterium hiemivividum]TDE04943.1 phosphatidylserine decarboxylase [Flavobacterium hiemivividum]
MKITKTKKNWGITLLLLAIVAILAFYPLPEQAPIQYYDRETGVLKTEKVAAEKWLVWLYNNPVGEVTLWTLVKRKFVSTIYGDMMDRPSSTDKIQPFIKEFGIDMNVFQKQEYNSFNEFFTRKINDNARPIDTTATITVSPADGKILAYADISNSDFIVKGYRFDIASFLNNAELAKKYIDGSLVIIRLAPADYHRYHFPVSGNVSANTKIDGDYYSVNPLALRKMTEIFCLNKREYTIVSNPVFGDVVMAEVGATMVGSMVQTYSGDVIKKGDEKGYFKFGGSTVVLLFEKNKISIDADLLSNTLKGFETSAIQGERIGVSTIRP